MEGSSSWSSNRPPIRNEPAAAASLALISAMLLYARRAFVRPRLVLFALQGRLFLEDASNLNRMAVSPRLAKTSASQADWAAAMASSLSSRRRLYGQRQPRRFLQGAGSLSGSELLLRFCVRDSPLTVTIISNRLLQGIPFSYQRVALGQRLLRVPRLAFGFVLLHARLDSFFSLCSWAARASAALASYDRPRIFLPPKRRNCLTSLLSLRCIFFIN